MPWIERSVASWRAVEALEQPVLLGGGDPDAGVGDLDHRAAVAALGAHGDRPAGRRELDRVGHEVVDDLGEPVGVAGERRDRVGLGDQLQAGLLGTRAAGRDGVAHDGLEIDLAALEVERSGLDLGDEEQVADEPQQPARVALHHAEEVALVD